MLARRFQRKQQHTDNIENALFGVAVGRFVMAHAMLLAQWAQLKADEAALEAEHMASAVQELAGSAEEINASVEEAAATLAHLAESGERALDDLAAELVRQARAETVAELAEKSLELLKGFISLKKAIAELAASRARNGGRA